MEENSEDRVEVKMPNQQLRTNIMALWVWQMGTTFRTNLLLPASGYLPETRDPSEISNPKGAKH
jgi:hypothetical protein